jgi:hypothetical protein
MRKVISLKDIVTSAPQELLKEIIQIHKYVERMEIPCTDCERASASFIQIFIHHDSFFAVRDIKVPREFCDDCSRNKKTDFVTISEFTGDCWEVIESYILTRIIMD